MSTDELVRGIRRIVGDRDAKPTGLADAEARKAIGISRGIGFIRADGTVAGGGAEGGGNDASPPSVPTDQPDSGGGVPADAGGTTGGGDVGGRTVLNGDVADVDDATVDNTAIGAVTGTDPTTGSLTSVKFDSLAGIEYTPPDGWSDPDTSPFYTTKYINRTTAPTSCRAGNGTGITDGQVFYSVEAAYQAELDAITAAWAGNNIVGLGFYLCDAPDYAFNIKVFQPITENLLFATAGGCFTIALSVPEQDPSETEHPTDGVCSVAYDHEAGGYKGHALDPDCSAAQKTASNFVIIRSQSDPSRYFRYTRLANGGTKVTEVDSGGAPKPGTVTKLLDGQGNVTGFVDVSLDNFYQ